MIVTALALWLTSVLITSVVLLPTYPGWATALAAVGVALVLCLVQDFIRPVVKALTGCLYLLTLGLFSLVVNALMLWLTTSMTTGWFETWGLRIDGGFWTYVLAALVVAILQTVIGWFAPKRRHLGVI